jgi:hypothetical protein
MRLSAARDLKEEILAMLPSFVVRDDGETPAIAVGVAPAMRTTDYRIAVRARYEHDLPPAATRYLQRATTGSLDLRVTGPITPAAGRVVVGASTAHARGRLGTLGCFARRNGDGRIGFISNNHVIAGEDSGVDGDDVLYIGQDGPERVIGRLAGDYPRLKNAGPTVDCAFAHLVQGVQFEPAILTDGEMLSAVPVAASGHLDVRKIGRSTGRTEGRISAFSMSDVCVDYSFGPVLFQDQIEIESLTSQPFIAPGDSGSLIFTIDRHPVGLVCAGSAIGGRTNAGLTYANSAGAVFASLDVTLLT